MAIKQATATGRFRRMRVSALLLALYSAALLAETGVRIDIPEQTLDAALRQLGKQAGVQLVFTPEIIGQQRGRAVRGEMSVNAALQALLAGSGLGFRQEGERNFVVVRQPRSVNDSVVLPEVSVVAAALARSYGVVSSSTGTKTNTPLLETPVAVQIVPKSVLEDKQITSIQEAVKQVSGVQPPQSSFLYYDTFIIRGLQTQNNIFRNGLKLTAVAGTTDLAFIERLEIAKGPSSMLYGRVWPGGMVNIATKTPQAETALSVQQQFGSWNTYRTTADATAAIDDEKTLRYRVIGVYDKGDSFINYQHHENQAVAAYFSWSPSADFKSNLQLEYYDQKGASLGSYAQTVPIIGNRPADLPRRWTQNDPVVWSNWPDTVERLNVAYDWSYAFNDQWKLTQRFNYFTLDENQSYIAFQAFNPATRMLSRKFSYLAASRTGYSTNLDLTGEFRTGGLKHRVLAGIDYFWTDFVLKGYSEGATLNRIPAINIYSPVYGNISLASMQGYFDSARANVFTRSRQKDYGFYLQDQVSLGDSWEVLVGGRYDVAKDGGVLVAGSTSAACFPNCTGQWNPNYPTDEYFSPRLGLLYKLTNSMSLYGSYSRSFDSTNLTSRSFDGSEFSPQTGEQYELGAKASFFEGNLNASATLFDLRQQNILTPDPVHSGYSVSTGEVHSQGLELDAAGEVASHISLIASFTYNPTEVSKDNTAGVNNTVGKQFVGVPSRSASLWAKYDSNPGGGEGFAYGLGVYANSERQLNALNTAQIPGYVRLDAMFAYRTKVGNKRLAAQLNVQNLTDKTYFEYGSASYAQYGAPRNVMASIRLDM